jgi:alpha-tubulin suppressor-like RCC1 family protein
MNESLVHKVNRCGELGVGHKKPVACQFQSIPKSIFSSPIVKVAGAEHCTWFLCEDGSLYHCGHNSSLSGMQSNVPTQKGLELLDSYRVMDVKCGEAHVLMTCYPKLSNNEENDLELFVAGRQTNYNCGLGHSKEVPLQKHPLVNDHSGNNGRKYAKVAKIFAGAQSSAYIGVDGSVWFAGKSKYGNLGLSCLDVDFATVFTKLSFNLPVKHIALGFSHTVLLTSNGECYGMGMDDSHQLGFNLLTQRLGHEPSIIPIPEKKVIKDVKAGNNHTLFLSEDGTVFLCGNNFHGESGADRSTVRCVHTPSRSETIEQILNNNGTRPPSKIQSIFAGSWHSICITNDNRLIVFGYNSMNQLMIPDIMKSLDNDRLQNVALLDLPWVHEKLNHANCLELNVACGQQHSVLYFINNLPLKRIIYFRKKLQESLQNCLFCDLDIIASTLNYESTIF